MGVFADTPKVLDTTIDTTADLVEHRHGSEAGKAAKGIHPTTPGLVIVYGSLKR